VDFAVAALADERRKGNPSVTGPAELAAQDGIHGDGVPLDDREERLGMAIGAIKPTRMGAMGKANVGHGFGIGHDDVLFEHLHGLFSQDIRPGIDQFLIERLYPVDLSQAIMGKRIECLSWFLQRIQGSVAGIVIAVFGKGDMVGIFGISQTDRPDDSDADGQKQPSDA